MGVLEYGQDVSDLVRKKVRIGMALVIICFAGLGIRVWYLQIVQGQFFKTLSENNRVRIVPLPGYRGLIKDRNGVTLVKIRPSFNLYITPEDVKNLDQTLDGLSKRINFNRKKVEKDIQNARSHKDVLILFDIKRDEVAYIEENKLRFPGINLKVDPLRNYVFNELSSHTLGYLGEISRKALKTLKKVGYRQGDLIGKDGLEKIFEKSLHGVKGLKAVEVDASGRELRVLRKLSPKSGNHITLTLDYRIQKIAEELMTESPEEVKNGAIVVMDIPTGEILAMVSKPSFDANLFSSGISRGDWKNLVQDENHPLQNRVIDGQYPPGSTYKIVTAYAALEEGVVTPNTKFFCPGEFRLGRGRYRCWKKKGHGKINIHQALVESCDVFFYNLGNRLGVDRLSEYARKMGLGGFTKINLSGEKPGLIPSSKWKLLSRGEVWQPGETISASIGQGFNLVTPLQQVNMIAAVAGSGNLTRPKLVRFIEGSDGKITKIFKPEVLSDGHLNIGSLDIIRNALRGVVNEPHGTGKKARLRKVIVAGKTGTAQVVAMRRGDEKLEEDEIPYRFRDHAWFIAFAPFENPKIAIAVILEHGGHGGVSAAPIAKKVIQAYFKYYPIDTTVVKTKR